MTFWLAQLVLHLWPLTDPFGGPLPFGAVARCGPAAGAWPRTVHQVAVAADGRTLALQCVEEPWVRCSAWPPGAAPRQLPGPPGITALTLSPDGTVLAAARPQGLCLWEVAEGRPPRTWAADGGPFHSLAFAPDGRLYAVGAGKELFCFEAATGALAWRRDLEQRGPRQVVAAGAHLAVAGVGWFQVWDAARKEILWEETGRGNLPFRVALSPDGRELATAATGAEPLRVWDVATGRRRWRFPEATGECTGLAFSPDGRRLACAQRRDGQGVLRQADLTLGVVADLGPCHGQGLAYLRDGQTLLWLHPPEGLVTLNPSGRETPFHFTALTGDVADLAFSPDGQTLAAAAGGPVAHLFNPATGAARAAVPSKPGFLPLETVTRVRYLPDGSGLLLGAKGSGHRLWDLTTQQEAGQWKGIRLWSGDLAVAPDGRTALTFETELQVWDLTGPEARKRQIGGDGPRWARQTCFTPDGAQVIVLDWIKDELRISPVPPEGGTWAWRKLAPALPGRNDRPLLTVTADGRLVVYAHGKGRLAVCDLGSRQNASPFAEPLTGTAWALSPSGRLLAQGDTDGTVRVWELATGALRATFPGGHQDLAVTALAWHPAGRGLASGGADHGILVWDTVALPFGGGPAPGPAELPSLWEALAGGDGRAVHRAIGRLVQAGPAGLAYLAERLPPATPPEPLDRLTADLGDERFAVRDRATRALLALGGQARPALERVIRESVKAEARRRAEELLQQLASPPWAPERLRTVRAVEVAEDAGTPAARALLERWAGGAAGAELTEEAARALARWRRREGPR